MATETQFQEKTVATTVPMPGTPDAIVHIRISAQQRSLTVLVTTANLDEASKLAPLGSFVYAIPDRFNPEPLCRPICEDEPTLDFATTLAKMLARKARQPVYVGCSVQLDRMPLGGAVEEKLQVLQAISKVVVPVLDEKRETM